MKLKSLKSVLHSEVGFIQMAILYDWRAREDVALGSVDYMVKNYGESVVKTIRSDYDDKCGSALVICVDKAIKSK